MKMRQKKSNMIYYVIAAVVIAAVGFIVLHEIPLVPEHVEEVIK